MILREICNVYYERRSYIMAQNTIKIIGLVATVVGLTANLVSTWVTEQKMDAEIEAKVAEKLSELKK